MPTLEESAKNAGSQLSTVLNAAVETLSVHQEITFRLYVRQILPLDGWLFWVRADLLSAEEIEKLGVTQDFTFNARGSLHRQAVTAQTEDATQAVNSIIFTSEEQISDFNAENPVTLYLGEYEGTRFSFSRMNSRYTQAGIYHYVGDALLATMRDQVIDSADDLDLDDAVVSSSLPIWLGLNSVMPMYPAMLALQNLSPPFATVKCYSTAPVGAGFYLDSTESQYQLVSETVKVTITGLRNAAAQDFIRLVHDYSLSADAEMGIMNIPVVEDERITQSELNILAMRKTITFQINYYQQRMRDTARKLILSAIPSFNVGQ